jgi:hypothetical protein
MNSNKYFILIIAAISCMFYSCYKDKGNYSYKELNRINKIENIKKEYSIYKGEDILKITPGFSFNNKNKDTYEYKWILHISDKEKMVISTKKDLVFDSKGKIFPTKKLNLTFVAKNLITNVLISETFKVNFMHRYTKGTFILHENGEDSELTFINTKGKITSNIYQKITGRNLKGKPIKIDIHTIPSIFLCLTNDNTDYGAVLDYSTLKYRYPVSDCFRGKTPPENLKFNFPDIDEREDGVTYYFSINNKLYKTIFNKNLETNPYITLGFPEITNDNMIDYVETGYTNIVHSANGNLYLWGGKTILKIDDEVFKMPGKCFYIFEEPLLDDGGGEEEEEEEEEVKIHILIKETDNTVKEYVLTMNIMIDDDEDIEIYTYKVSSYLLAAPEHITEKSVFANSAFERYLYIAKDNKIYRYNYDAPNDHPVVFKEFDPTLEITYFKMIKIYDDDDEIEREEFMVCTYDPNKVDKNKAASLYHYSYSGVLINKYENICGKINSIVIKK